jgi:hypothetical protein
MLRPAPFINVVACSICLIAGLSAGLPPRAWAADISVGPPGKTIYIEGEITDGDAAAFNAVIENEKSEFQKKFGKPPQNVVWIVRPVSNGGSVLEAMEIGRIIRANGIWVLTNAPGQTCASACVLLFAPSVYKLPGEGSIGIHRPTFPSQVFAGLPQREALRRYRELAEQVRQYLAEMDVHPMLFEDMMAIGSDDVKWLSLDRLVSYGLAGPTAAYAEWQHARDVEDRKELVMRFGEAKVRQHESAKEASIRFATQCADQRGMAAVKACVAEADRRFPDPLKGQLE